MGMKVPKYRKHSGGSAFICWRGKRHYLGEFNTAESKAAYSRFLKKYVIPSLDLQGVAAKGQVPESTVGGLCAGYLTHLKETLSPHGVSTWTGLLNFVVREVGEYLCSDFGPLDLKDVRQTLVDEGMHGPPEIEQITKKKRKYSKPLTRHYVNQCVDRIRRIFRWGVENELVPPDVLTALRAVQGLRIGRTTAPENEPIEPADPAAVDAVLAILHPIGVDMVRVHQLTGMRPGDLCRMTPGEIDRSADVWIYQPLKHKTAYRGRKRQVPIGPKCQAILRPYLDRAGGKCLFSPAEAVAQFNEARRKRSKKATAKKRIRPPADEYTPHSYRKMIDRAIERINLQRDKDGQPQIKPWSPNQLRHSLGTEVRKKFGLEGAQVMLGHARADVTQIYAERDLGLAIRIAAELG